MSRPSSNAAERGGAVGDRRFEIGVPGVEVGVEMHECQWPVDGVQCAKVRQCDGVVTADRDEPALPLADDVAHTVLDLRAGFRDVERCDGHVSGVDDLHLVQRGNTEFE